MPYADRLQTLHHLEETRRHLSQRHWIAEASLDKTLERLAFDPLHLQDGIPGSPDIDSLFEKLKRHRIQQPDLLEVRADRRIAPLLVRKFMCEALHGPRA